MRRSRRVALSVGLLAAAAAAGAFVSAASGRSSPPLALADLGSFSFGGRVITTPSGQTLHCDHGYAQYYRPVGARQYPLLMWHSSSVKTWETTPDGRDGFQNIFLRRGFAVYTFDPPRVGRAAQSCVAMNSPVDVDRGGSTYHSYGKTPAFNEQFVRARYPENPEVGSPEWTPDDPEIPGVVALLEKTGDGILLTHSGSGSRGWLAATKSQRVKAIVAYDPINFVFPASEPPPAVSPVLAGLSGRITTPLLVPAQEFGHLTRPKIQIVFSEAFGDGASDMNRVVRQRAAQFIEAVNRDGGDARILSLPAAGVRGTTHFSMQDPDNVQVADLLSQFLHEKGLDRR